MGTGEKEVKKFDGKGWERWSWVVFVLLLTETGAMGFHQKWVSGLSERDISTSQGLVVLLTALSLGFAWLYCREFDIPHGVGRWQTWWKVFQLGWVACFLVGYQWYFEMSPSGHFVGSLLGCLLLVHIVMVVWVREEKQEGTS